MAKFTMVDLRTLPARYKHDYTAMTICKNLIDLIEFACEGSLDNFKDALREKIGKNNDDADAFMNRFSQQLREENRRLTAELSRKICHYLQLPNEALLSHRVEKEVAYVFVQCKPRHTNMLFEKLTNMCKENRSSIVDEVSIVSGDADIFLRLFGTRRKIKEYLTKIIANEDMPIEKTYTHFSFEDEVYMRYPVATHRNWVGAKPYWIPDGWQIRMKENKLSELVST